MTTNVEGGYREKRKLYILFGEMYISARYNNSKI
jgi:hypothetical protein